MTMIHMNNITDDLFVNIDITAVYFDTNSTYTVSEKGAKRLLGDVAAVRTNDVHSALLWLLMERNCRYL